MGWSLDVCPRVLLMKNPILLVPQKFGVNSHRQHGQGVLSFINEKVVRLNLTGNRTFLKRTSTDHRSFRNFNRLGVQQRIRLRGAASIGRKI